MTTTKVKKFFDEYERGANNFDPELVRSLFVANFMGADPNGVVCIPNDDKFRDAIVQRRDLFKQLGFQCAEILHLTETRVDDKYTMVEVHWHMIFEKEPGKEQDFKFFITYFVFDSAEGLKIVFYISREDERKVMREAGLLR
jgi:hypothetical protein